MPGRKENQSKDKINLDSLLKGQYKDLNKMTVEEMKEELQIWRQIFTNLDDVVKYWILKIGSYIRVYTRMGRTNEGILVDVEFTPKTITIGEIAKQYDALSGKYYIEKRSTTIKFDYVWNYNIIIDRQLAVEEEEVPRDMEEQISQYELEEEGLEEE